VQALYVTVNLMKPADYTPADCTPDHRRARAAGCPAADVHTPADRYQELFVAVQSGRVFSDSKTFVDCAPRAEPADILAAYRAQHDAPGFDLPAFVEKHFTPPQVAESDYVCTPGQSLEAHIDSLWPVLTRQPTAHPPAGSLLPLPHEYVVPGGRFVEQYYWDSYFTMLGLRQSGQFELIHAMLENFAYLIDTFGHVPNGNRSYYLSRSQPPFFAWMVELGEACGGLPAHRYLPQLLREHAWWMRGAETLRSGEAAGRVVAVLGGAVLNRYWDERDQPREESWREDVATAAASSRPAQAVYRDIRAAAESGWDFSSRWFAEPDSARREAPSLSSICTTSIVPVDLNALMYRLERTIARLSREAADERVAEAFGRQAEARRAAIDALMWNEQEGAYFDYDWQQARRRRCLTAAAVTPLFSGMASPHQARRLADTVSRRLMAPGGLATTERASSEQWDRPNGWAPLQWMAAKGFDDYGCTSLAESIRSRWLATVRAVYAREGKLVEKYGLGEHPSARPCGGSGGEYQLQDGFGWTNGVTRSWLDERLATDTEGWSTSAEPAFGQQLEKTVFGPIQVQNRPSDQ
jgi:alpha,alpha-trehalase